MAAAPSALPALRRDLSLHDGPAEWDGARTYALYDPVRHAFHRIGARAEALLACWADGDAEAVRRGAAARLGEPVSAEEVEGLAGFLTQAGLIEPRADTAARLEAAAAKREKSLFARAAHAYIFFKVPLARPQRFLNATAWAVAPFFTRAAMWVWAALAVLGFYLVAQQWDVFFGTFLHFFSWQGAAAYGLTLIVIKSLHELGHAYAAHRFGVRTPVIGVGFILLFPILYTDTTDAYRLTARRPRLVIDAAGIAVELWIAAIATLAWVVLPDGPLRSAAFLAATAGWATSLLINASPFMRFDGYYLLADALDMPNLHARSFAMTRWSLRETLFGLGEPAPEPVSRGRRRAMVALGWGTWIYRLILFVGIALFVYQAFFKVLGVILFVIEIFWFVLKPIGAEMREWWTRRRAIMRRPRAWTSFGIVGALLILTLIPLPNRVTAPAVLRPANVAEVFAPAGGRLEAFDLTPGQRVEAGAPLARIASLDIAQARAEAERELALLKIRLARLSADAEDRAQRLVLLRQGASAQEKLAGLAARAEELVVRAPRAGVVRDVASDLAVGGVARAGALLARIVPGGAPEAVALVDERELALVVDGAGGLFVPNDPALPTTRLTLARLAPNAASALEEPSLASDFGGPLAVERAPDGRLRPVVSVFEARFAAEPGATETIDQSRVGVMRIEAAWNSLAGAAFRRVAGVFLREFGI